MTWGGYGQPGTRLTGILDLKTDLLAHILKPLVLVIALDVALFCIMLVGWLANHWLFVPLTLASFGLLVAWFLLVFGRPQDEWVRRIIGNLWILGLLAGVLLAAPFMPWSMWHWLNSGAMARIADKVRAAWALPPWVWFVAIGIWAIGAIRKVGKVIFGVLIASAVAWIGIRFDDWHLFATAWTRLRYLLIPYLWPVIGAMILLAWVMVQQELYPNLEWTLKPLSLEELREIGLMGLLAPRWFSQPSEAPVPERHVEIEFQTDKGRKFATLPDTPEAREFYRAIKRGETFALRTARKYGVSRLVFNSQIRDVFVERGWAEWKDDRHPQQGIDLLESGWQVIEHLVLADTTPHPTDEDVS